MKYVKWIDMKSQRDVETILLEASSGNIVIFSCAKIIADDKLRLLDDCITMLKRECQIRDFDVSTLGTFRGIVTPKDIRLWRHP